MMHSRIRQIASSLVAVLLMTSSAFAFDSPLSAEAIREAYFLGQQHDDKTLAFFSLYTRHLPLPQNGPHVSEVELLTPYAQIVEQSQQNTVGYSAQQAELDYRTRGNWIRVGVHVRYTATYGPGFRCSPNQLPGQTGTWKDFQVRLVQEGQKLEFRDSRCEATRVGVSGGKGGGSISTSTGFIIWLQYDASQLTSSDVSVEVDTPDGQHVVATFDLTHLR